MNITEHKLSLFYQIDDLSEESLLAVEKLIIRLKSKQNSKLQLVKNKSVWLGIAQWRKQEQFNENDEVLTDEMVASWRDKSSGRDFSWNS